MPNDERESNEAARLALRRLVVMNLTELRVTRQLSQGEVARRVSEQKRNVYVQAFG